MTNKQKELIKATLISNGFNTVEQQNTCISKYFQNGDLDYFDNLRASSPDEERKKISGGEYYAIKNFLKFYSGKSKKVEKINSKSRLTATEISDYVFCPVSFSIRRTYQIINDDESMQKGSFLHEVRNWKGNELSKNGRRLFDIKKEELPELYNNELVYEGHVDDSESYHIKELDIYCKPDLIFQGPSNKRYLIEEKYTGSFKRRPVYENQKVQLYIYLKAVPDLETGYLITWNHFEGNGDILKIQSLVDPANLSDYQVSLDDDRLSNKLEKTVAEMRSLIVKGVLYKTVVKSEAKCRSCRLKTHCLHFKNDHYKKIKFPYK